MFGAMKWMVLALLFSSFSCPAEECIPGRIKVQITNIEFEGTPGLTVALRNEIREQLEAKIHDYCQLADDMPQRARDLLQQHGYFKSLLRDPTWRKIGGTEQDQLIRVLLVIELGDLYRLRKITFRGQNAFDADTLRAAIPMADGEVFNVKLMRVGLRNLKDLYCSIGHASNFAIPNTEIDDENHWISILFDMEEGKQYRVVKLTLDGLEPKPGVGKKLLEAWAPNIGKIYDCDLWERWVAVLKPSIDAKTLAILSSDLGRSARINNETLTVDFQVDFFDPH
jgi:hypothetical protein